MAHVHIMHVEKTRGAQTHIQTEWILDTHQLNTIH